MSHSDNGQTKSAATRRRVLAAMGGASVVGLAGCVGGDGGDGSDGGDGTNEFVASAAANPGTFDPTIITDATSNSVVGTMAYERLVALTFDYSEFRGELASSYEQVDDTTFRFQLREGVTFHNGDEFTAEDVQFSINRTSGTTNDADVSFIENVEILGDYEVEITSTDPHAPFLNDLAAVPILTSKTDAISESPEQDDHSFTEQTLGTGPWELEEFSAEDRAVLVPYDDYWYDGDDYPGTAPWDRVTIRVIPEQVSQEEAMAAGELDMIDNAAPFELDQWENQTGEVVTGSAVGFDFITYPVNQSPFTNEKLRRGMTRLLPKSDVIEAVFGGYATELAGPISPGLGAFWDPEHEQNLLDEYVGQDEEEGLRLIGEAFEEEGIEAPFDVSFITNVNRTRERWMEIIQQTMDETEYFNAELDVRAFDDLVPFLLDPEGAAASTDVVGIGWTGGSDPDGHINQLLHSSQHVPDGFNWNLYENEEMDSLITEGQTTLGAEERLPIYQDIQELVAQEVPMANMWTGDVIDVLNPANVESVDQWSPHPNASNRYNTLYKPHLDEIVYPAE
ncbi:ABC transporter substrate-binding protein [Halorubrum ezzemoulense]|uniref:ABC transporter substrate-binding protein n=2 Tax=Haloferacaceae TaxID=1644056 RepID=A0A256K9N0_HALEZ|nr:MULTISPECIES: ABC transporter substrate-binding protein [Halorubrum]MDB2223089.1 ABC transporter substrate-binding protein [Halorubrum ezzemoulense]MDB2237944.1 ABC transporter substrate-binding protein [Halorubrum ezzemoulense]MDB2249538.1 ABC transporter substrate-binding protein [Halorubrum ezzemoulense]MDB2271736.1 ABC transporter substrate-binding protein [Halorubrum ezzemoulense]MDB9248445.1 ABC transporter substrate-binding protein [Halorubrum ezzemoulense]